MFMKKITLFFLVWLFAASCATVKTAADRSAKTSPPDPPDKSGQALSTGRGGAAQSATAGCNTPPVYYTGNDEPAAYGLFLASDEPVSVSSQQLQSAAPSGNEAFLSPSPVERVPEGRERSERAGGEVVSAGGEVPSAGCTTPPVYYTGNDEPAAYGLFLVTDELTE
jgi:hypothetical protein